MQKKSNMGIGKPSKRQAEILQFISEFRPKKGYAPSLAEIAENFDVSVPTIHQHISYLRKKNLLTTEKGKRRSIQTLNTRKGGIVEILLMGLIAAGGPIEAIRDPRPIEVPRNMLSAGANFYALKVAGTSMIEDGIFDGDYVIIERNPSPKNGDVVVALLDNAFATLKRFYREAGFIRLQPANSTMKPIIIHGDINIQGTVRAVIRKFTNF